MTAFARRWIPRGLLGRSVVAAGLVTVVLVIAAWWWVRSVAYDNQRDADRSLARSQVDQILAQTQNGVRLSGDYGVFPYELVAADGVVVSSSASVKPFETHGSVMPAPGYGGPLPLYRVYAAHFPTGVDSPLAGTSPEAVSGTISAADVVEAGNGRPGNVTASARYRVYVFVTTGRADEARYSVDQALWVALPIAVFLVAGIVAFAVSRSLRAVRVMAANTRAVTADDPRERVTVPASGDAIEELAHTINSTLDRLETSQRRQRNFVADASHELRSPLAALRFGLEVAQEHPDSASPDEVIASAVSSVDRLESLVDDMLGLARLDARALPPSELITMATLVTEALNNVRVPPRITLRVDLAAVGSAQVDLATQLLRRALVNVIVNAMRHARSTVDIVADITAGEAIVDVIDDGAGIPIADRERVFERFVRLDDARDRDSGGSGLGLALAREAIVACSGRIAVADSEIGTRVRITVPRATTTDS